MSFTLRAGNLSFLLCLDFLTHKASVVTKCGYVSFPSAVTAALQPVGQFQLCFTHTFIGPSVVQK